MHRRTKLWAGRVERGGCVLHKGITASDENPFGHPSLSRRIKKNQRQPGGEAHTRKTPAVGARVGGEFKSFTCCREISSSNQQRQF